MDKPKTYLDRIGGGSDKYVLYLIRTKIATKCLSALTVCMTRAPITGTTPN